MERPDYLKLMEEQLENDLKDLPYREEGSKARAALESEIETLTKLLQARDTAEFEYAEKIARRLMEQKRNEDQNAVEKAKLKMPKSRIVLALIEIFTPIVFASALVPYMAKWEENNRQTSSIGREIWNLPKLFLKKYR